MGASRPTTCLYLFAGGSDVKQLDVQGLLQAMSYSCLNVGQQPRWMRASEKPNHHRARVDPKPITLLLATCMHNWDVGADGQVMHLRAGEPVRIFISPRFGRKKRDIR